MKLNNFRYWFILWALLVTWLVCALGCQSKKKALDIQKSATVIRSEVQKESSEALVDQSSSKVIYSDQSKISVVEEWFRADTGSLVTVLPYYRKITYQANDIKKVDVLLSDVNKTLNVKLDSSGKSESTIKSKIQSKDVKDNVTGKAIGIGFLVLVILAAVVYIRYQIKKAKSIM